MVNEESVGAAEFRELVELARAVLGMRRAQTAYFRAKSASPPNFTAIRDRLSEARDRERQVDQIVGRVLHRERVALPGIEDAPLCPFCVPPSGVSISLDGVPGWYRCKNCNVLYNPTTKASAKPKGVK